ncbi:AAA family ATPase [Buchananella felis]|uniref:AAA family ATPase n=1 Tax=Buchananella felis TaxID=3231492 RepID=UPI00352892A8
MFDVFRLREILADYKRDFDARHWAEEKHKWEAVRHFQENWDVEATNFSRMLERSLAKTSKLLASTNNFPAGMIVDLAKEAPEEVRDLFVSLFDESRDYYERIEAFKHGAQRLLETHGHGAKQHFQSENAITTYLWLRYPDRYYVYRFGEAKTASQVLGTSYRFRKGEYKDNLRNHLAFYDEICATLQEDPELAGLLQSQLTPDCYSDPSLRTLTADFCYYVGQHFAHEPQTTAQEWTPSKDQYHPGLSVDDWLALLHDENVFTRSSLEIVARIKDCGGESSCKYLAQKYGGSYNVYLSGSVGLAKRVAKKTGCPVPGREDGSAQWWRVLYIGRDAEKDEVGSFIWRLRPELLAALDRFDTSEVALYASNEPNGEEEPLDRERHYWWLNANPRKWSFADIAVGEEQSYTLYNERGNKRRIHQHFLDARAGDLVIGYESTPVKQIVALGRIVAEQDGERLRFEKTEGLPTPIDYEVFAACQELRDMEYLKNPMGSLFKLTPEEYDFLLDLIREENPVPEEKGAAGYSRADFLAEVYMTEDRYDQLVSVLGHKKNIILQGAPGVGKTFAARRLAWSLMGEKDDTRIEFVQFHQNYSYEDFMLGYKPQGEGFELQYGVFYRFCQRAANQPDKDFFFIIDEINRGNLSKIFGELLMLIERDYRGHKATLAYNGMNFSVPANLHIIGMMNTADRSLALIDYALRRRFSFFEIEPGFDSKGFTFLRKALASEAFDRLVGVVKELNADIRKDRSLGRGFCIGHSYFCGRPEATEKWLTEVVDYDLAPMLREYWFDDEDKAESWIRKLHEVLKP